MDRNEASDLQALFLDQATLATIPDSIAHAALYPYVNEELFYRYARLNDALNKTELRSRLEQISVPTLVVAGDCDETTHLGGSKHIAESISDALFHVERNGSHLAFFESTLVSKQTAFRFLESALVSTVGSAHLA